MDHDHSTRAYGTILMRDQTARPAVMLRSGARGGVCYSPAGRSSSDYNRRATAYNAVTFKLDPQQAAWLHEQALAEDRARTAVAESDELAEDDAARDAEDDKLEQQLMVELVDTVDALTRAGVPRSVAIERTGRLVGICAPTDDRSRTIVANAAIKAFGNVGQAFGPHPYVPGDVVNWARGYRPGSRLAGLDMPELGDDD